jgi:hypothetical protein
MTKIPNSKPDGIVKSPNSVNPAKAVVQKLLKSLDFGFSGCVIIRHPGQVPRSGREPGSKTY